jgi:uncharacterized alpha-E superfamily protein
MLTRLAAHAVWMARYLERAESLTRLVIVTQHLSLLPDYAGASEAPWIDTLAVIGGVAPFAAKHGAVTPDTVLDYLLLDRDHSSSLLSSISSARDNARSARSVLTEHLWESINSLWLASQAIDRDHLAQRGIDEVGATVIAGCCQIRGAADELLRDEVPHALSLGQAVERADHLARLIGVFLRGELADPEIEVIPGTPAYRRWEALLSAASLDETYRRAHHAHLDPELALRLMLTHPSSPRSLLVTTQRIRNALAGLLGPTRIPATTGDALLHLEEHLLDAQDGGMLTAHLGTYLSTLTRLADAVGVQVNRDLA